ncbi:superoxide dismutase family protein [Streptosporangium sp. V21-05]|uniref:superoxide dismutase family protein n=1 Tax=Streptosporangium sp. V21-05 TaxID=3446115 RepID=UPI003F535FB6
MFHRTCLALTVALGALAAGTLPAAQATSRTPGISQGSAPSAKAVIKNTAGKNIGFLRIDHRPGDKSRLTVTVAGLRAGYHGFHVHAKGVCDPGAIDPVTRSPFASAGPHFTIPPVAHSGHSGDLPNLLVAADGTGEATVVTDRFRVAQLFDADGSSVVVHALPDNHSNIPDRYSHQGPPSGVGPDAETLKAGDSGGRVACGVITRNQ